jgi:hypothetical protein
VSDEIGVLRLAAIDENVRVPPFALALAGATGEATSALFHPALSPLERNAVERVALTSDASVLDGSRARSWTPVDLEAPGSALRERDIRRREGSWHDVLVLRVGRSCWGATGHGPLP